MRIGTILAGAVFAFAVLSGCGDRDRGPAVADAKSPGARVSDGPATPAESPALAAPAVPSARANAPATASTGAALGASADEAGHSRSKAKLSHASASVDELMTRVLEALSTADVAALEALRLTEDEHREVLWPDDPGRAAGAPLDLAWDMLDRRSRSGTRKAIDEMGGRTLSLAGIEFTAGIERRPTYVLHRGTVLHARDTSRGESVELRYLGSVIELDGQWKLVSFRD